MTATQDPQVDRNAQNTAQEPRRSGRPPGGTGGPGRGHKTRETRPCTVCGKAVTRKPSAFSASGFVSCSDECWGKYTKRNNETRDPVKRAKTQARKQYIYEQCGPMINRSYAEVSRELGVSREHVRQVYVNKPKGI